MFPATQDRQKAHGFTIVLSVANVSAGVIGWLNSVLHLASLFKGSMTAVFYGCLSRGLVVLWLVLMIISSIIIADKNGNVMSFISHMLTRCSATQNSWIVCRGRGRGERKQHILTIAFYVVTRHYKDSKVGHCKGRNVKTKSVKREDCQAIFQGWSLSGVEGLRGGLVDDVLAVQALRTLHSDTHIKAIDVYQ